MKRLVLLLIFITSVTLFTVSAGSVKVVSTGQLERVDSQNDTLSAIYVCNDFSNVTVEFTPDASSSTIFTWYQYDKSGTTPVLIPGESLSTLKITSGNQGYMVNDGRKNYWVWIVDYQEYMKNATLTIQDNSHPCEELYLNAQGFTMNYYEPLSSIAHSISLDLSIHYNTMAFEESAKAYQSKQTSLSFSKNGPIYLSKEEVPLMDTKFSVYDQFSTKWGLKNTVQTDTYSTLRVAIECLHVHDPLNNAENNTGKSSEAADALSGSAPFDITFNAYGNKPVATYFSWTITDLSDGSKLTTSTDDNISYSFTKKGSYKVLALVTNAANSCIDSVSYTITVSESVLKVPNAFSPGTSPGANDEFRVAYKSLLKFECWIFNRWGVQLYHWTDPAQGWDGKVHGKYVTPGVYFYVIEAEGSDGIKYKQKGSVNVFSGQ